MTRITGSCGGIDLASRCKDQGAGVTCTLAVMYIDDTTAIAYIDGHYSTTYHRAPVYVNDTLVPNYLGLFAESGSTVVFKDLKVWVV